jgi:signal transduction histidine kinase
MVETRSAAPTSPSRRLVRPTSGRVVAGVCRGLAEHLGLDVMAVRVAFVILTLSGAGVVAYAAFWIFAPQVDQPEADANSEATGGRELGYVIGLAAVAVGLLLATRAVGLHVGGSYIWPLLVIAVGVVLLWQQADDAQRARWTAATLADRRIGFARAGAGLALVLTGTVAFLGPGDLSMSVNVLMATLVIVAGLALLSSPWWIRMARDLAAERAARIREQERAEVAAHVHDSVLHTLTLIQRHVDDPREVTRLARAQERELRTWLYRPVADPDATLTAALERAAADVEDAHGVAVELVTVGDCALDDPLRATLLATREALVNAAKYAGSSPISLFGEVEQECVTIFVRDRGDGFDLDTVPEDRLGVRQSIIGRMRRNGGSAVVHSAPGEGTEVQLEMPRSQQ